MWSQPASGSRLTSRLIIVCSSGAIPAASSLPGSDAVEIAEANEHIVGCRNFSVVSFGCRGGLRCSFDATGDAFQLIQAEFSVEAVGGGGSHGSLWSVGCRGRSPMTTPSPQSIDHGMTCVRRDRDLGHRPCTCRSNPTKGQGDGSSQISESTTNLIVNIAGY